MANKSVGNNGQWNRTILVAHQIRARGISMTYDIQQMHNWNLPYRGSKTTRSVRTSLNIAKLKSTRYQADAGMIKLLTFLEPAPACPFFPSHAVQRYGH